MCILRCSWCTLLLLALFASPHDANSISPSLARSRAAASLGKSLASLFLVKEGSVPGAKQSMSIFQVTLECMHAAHQRTMLQCSSRHALPLSHHSPWVARPFTNSTVVHLDSCMRLSGGRSVL